MTQLRFAPIIRVSTEKQEQKGSSLIVQEKQIKAAVESMGGMIPDNCWKYKGQEHATPEYERKRIDQLLVDSGKGLFDAVICVDASRWSRDNRKSKEGIEILKNNGIRFFIGTREMDLFDPQHRFELGITTELNEYAALSLAKKSLENKIEKAHSGQPTTGAIPFGRIWDKKTKKWSVDQEKKDKVNYAAKRYLEGGSLQNIAAELGIPVPTLWKYMMRVSGDSYIQHFHSDKFNIHDDVITEIPELLDKETIRKLEQETLARRTFKHGDYKNQYLLKRVIFCGHCGHALTGTSNSNGLRYYRHLTEVPEKCLKSRVPANEIENLVILELVKMLGDPIRIQESIERSNPDSKEQEGLKAEKKEKEGEVERITKERNNIVIAIGKEIITEEEARPTLNKFREQQTALNKRITEIEDRLKTMPNPENIKRISDFAMNVVDRAIQNRPALALNKDFEWKQKMIKNAFGGLDAYGKRLGVYIKQPDTTQRIFEVEIRGIIEPVILSLPPSDLYLAETFHLDSDFQDTASELTNIRIKLASNSIPYRQQ